MTNARMMGPNGSLVITLLLAACTGGGSLRAAAPTTTSGSVSAHAAATTSNNPRTGAPTRIPTVEPTAEAQPFCRTSMPASWTAAKVFEPRTVVGLSAHGYAQWSKPDLRWVALDGSQRPITTLAGAHTLGQKWPVGHYVAFQSAPSAEQNLGGGVLYLWDSTRRSRPVKVYESDDELPFDAVATVTTSDTQLSWLHPRKDGVARCSCMTSPPARRMSSTSDSSINSY